MEIKINEDIQEYKESIAFDLDMRQFFCSILAIVAGHLRHYSFGWHLNGFISCLIFGMVVYFSAILLVMKVNFSFWVLLLLWSIILVLVALFAPMDSAKRKIKEEQKPHYKKNLCKNIRKSKPMPNEPRLQSVSLQDVP